MQRGSSPGMDSVSMLNDFMPPPAAISPIGTMSSTLTDDMGLTMNGQINGAGRSKATPMQIRCKFGSLGASKAQFNSPHGFCLGVEEEIIVADTNNHRIEVKTKISSQQSQPLLTHLLSASRYSRRMVRSNFNLVYLAKRKDNCGIHAKWPLCEQTANLLFAIVVTNVLECKYSPRTDISSKRLLFGECKLASNVVAVPFCD